jgi:hypothetical protein
MNEHEPTVKELTVEEGREMFDRSARDALGISGDEFLRRYDANDIPAEWPHDKVCWLSVIVPFGR